MNTLKIAYIGIGNRGEQIIEVWDPGESNCLP